MNDRIKVLRKSLNLTLDEFGSRLGMTRGAISNIENGNRGITNQFIFSVCNVFGVNEEWLRTGECEMMNLPEDDDAALVSRLLEHGQDNPLYRTVLDIVSAFDKLTPNEQAVIMKLIRQFRMQNEEKAPE